jgi:large subunit ribosomal protein L18
MMNKIKSIVKRKIRVRSKIKGTQERPRLSVFRSNRFIYAQIIDDVRHATFVGISEKHLEDKKSSKKEKAEALGLLVAKNAVAKKIKKVVFDRGAYPYHGRISAFADGARKGGLEF